MQIQLKQDELTQAVCDYLRHQGITLENKTVEVSFTAGRRETGFYADVSIENPRNVTQHFNLVQAREDLAESINAELLMDDDEPVEPAQKTSLFS